MPVTYRDPWGVPHLRADSTEELAFLQGSNAAADRSWQIEMERWRSEGRTAEHLGSDGLLWDRFARQARINDTARRCFDNLDRETQRWVTAYVDGINDALSRGRRQAQEFRDTGTEPGPWDPWTPLGVFLVHHILFSTFPNKLWRDHVAHTLGPDAVDLFSIEAPVWAGSNAWAVTGSLAAGGSPLLAGDPHRLMELPGVYQQVRLACPEFDAVGLAFPGVPGLPHFGHAGAAAWAVTNAMADYQDLYREQLRRDGGTLYALGPDGWEPVAADHEEQIRVRGGATEAVQVVETVRGPVITSGYDGGTLSLRMPSRVGGRLGFEALLPLLRCRSAADVEAAFGAWVEPVNCVLAADSAGGVRQFVAGAVPERNHGNRVRPVPAESQGHQWTGGWVALPASDVETLAVNANDRASGGGHLTGLEFAPSHRADRIRELLAEAGSGLDAGSMQRTHMDSRLGSWPALRAVLERCGTAAPLSSAAADLRRSLLGWDGGMRADSSLAAAFAGWRSAFVRALASAPLLAPLARPTGHSPLFSPWLDPVSRVGFALETIVAKGDASGLDVAAAATEALEAAAASPSSAAWGQTHVALPLHALADHPSAGAKAPRVPMTPLSGDTGCVLSTENLPGVTDASFRGPVARYVWDLGDRSRSRWVVPFGTSGDPGDANFLSQLPLWAAGELLPVITDWDQLSRENHDEGEP
ncbi:penicillin acylase family protein [Pseudarthrobacter sp. 1G09]|uniref:penicillin acylase family protein n=1 Tax=Pseudarthrobacter sp. 1G09 TaxID=3416178 RepID=UPI003CF7DA68